MDIRQLRYFVGVVQAGSLSRAAEQLHVVQSAISHQLAGLESELDRQLLTRGPKGIVLTDAGAVLYRYAETILRQVESAKRDTTNALNVPLGRVSIGLPGILAPMLGYELLRRVRTAYPQIAMHLSDTTSWILRERLVNGRLDMGLLYLARPERGLAVEPLLSEELFYMTADPDTSPIELAEAAQRPLLVAGPGSSARKVTEEAFNKHGLVLSPVAEIDSLSALRRAIASGMGNAILPLSVLYDGEQRTALNYRRITGAKLAQSVALCFSEVGQRSPAIEAVALTLKSLMRELVESGTWQGVSLIVDPEELSASLVPPS